MKDKEIEIQVRIEDCRQLLLFLEKEGTFKWERRQLDLYLTPAVNSFVAERPVRKWLRLRDADGKCSLDFKNWHYDGSGKSEWCDEFETSIGEIEQAKKILTALGFETLTTVDKVRRCWRYGDYEVALDSVKDLGEFVEIEYKGDDCNVDPAEITEAMIAFLKNTGCGTITRNFVGYPFLLLFGDEAEWKAA